MEERMTYLLFMFTVGRFVIQTLCTSQKKFTCGKSAHCTIVITEEKVWPIDLFSLYILFSHFRPRDATRGNSFFQMSSQHVQMYA